MTNDPNPSQTEALLADEQAYWSWLRGEGLGQFVNAWLALHIALGVALAFAVDRPLSAIASTALVPLVSILVGLAFAWFGNVASLLITDRLQLVGDDADRRTYVGWTFTYQTAILCVLVALLLWSFLAAGVVDGEAVRALRPGVRYAGRAAAFALTSVAVRECWQVTLAVQKKLIMHMQVGRALHRRQGPESGEAMYRLYTEAYEVTRTKGSLAKAPARLGEMGAIALGVRDAENDRALRSPDDFESQLELVEDPPKPPRLVGERPNH